MKRAYNFYTVVSGVEEELVLSNQSRLGVEPFGHETETCRVFLKQVFTIHTLIQFMSQQEIDGIPNSYKNEYNAD